jgi:hypothetical protein
MRCSYFSQLLFAYLPTAYVSKNIWMYSLVPNRLFAVARKHVLRDREQKWILLSMVSNLEKELPQARILPRASTISEC